MFQTYSQHAVSPARAASIFLGLLLGVPALALDYPLSSEDIREAYFLGTREAGAGSAFLRQYSHAVPELKVGSYVSRVRIETPFFHVAEHSSRALNYSAQNAVKDFYGKPAVLRVYLEICYQIDAPLPNAVKIKVIQRKKEIPPLSDERTAFFPPSDVYDRAPNLGEEVTLEFDPAKFDSSDLIVQIDTPDGQRGQVEFQLQTLR